MGWLKLSRRQSLVAGVGGAVALMLLALQLASIDQQRRIARSQDRNVGLLLEKARAAERGAEPLLADVRDLAPQVERAGRSAAETIADARPLIEGLQAADVPGAVRRWEALSVGVSSLIEELAERGVVAALARLEVLPELLELQRRSLHTQQRSLAVQRQTLEILERSLAVQEATLVHVRSVDRRTGGSLDPR